MSFKKSRSKCKIRKFKFRIFRKRRGIPNHGQRKRKIEGYMDRIDKEKEEREKEGEGGRWFALVLLSLRTDLTTHLVCLDAILRESGEGVREQSQRVSD